MGRLTQFGYCEAAGAATNLTNSLAMAAQP